MSTDIAFFLARDDRSAAATHRGGPNGFPSVTGHYFYGDDAVDEWDAYFVGPSPDLPRRGLTFWRRPRRPATPPAPQRWIVPVTNDGSGMFALPPRLTRSLTGASTEELEELAARWAERLRREDGDDMTDDDLPAIVQAVAQLATTAVTTGGNLYCWFY